MLERRRFIEEWRSGDWSVQSLCQAYGIGRTTAYKWLSRYHAEGLEGLKERPRANHVHPNATDGVLEARIVDLRRRHPFWGPRKLKARLLRLEPSAAWPATSTIGEIIKRHGLVLPRRRRARTSGYEGPFYAGLEPNDVWAADFKGWFRTKDGSRIDPFTVTDLASRYLVRCRAVKSTDGQSVKSQLTAAFHEFGLPKALRTDNGVPFASVGLGGLSELAVWLIRLGVQPERIRPSHPEENGAHERMHRTLKQETANPPAANPRAQQASFDRFQVVYNVERPHETLTMRAPGDIFVPSPRPMPKKLPEVEYSAGDTVRLVTTNGCINFKDKRIYLSKALIDERVKVEEREEGWCVSYGSIRLGTLDLEREMIKRQKTVFAMRPV